MTARAALVILPIVVAAALALAACGGEEAGPDPVGEESAGSVVLLADCGDWHQGTRDQRLATIDAIRAESGERNATQTDEELYEFFDANCAPEYASTFRLYKLYAGAAPFIGLDR